MRQATAGALLGSLHVGTVGAYSSPMDTLTNGATNMIKLEKIAAWVRGHGNVAYIVGGAVMIEAEQQSDWVAEGHTSTDPITASWDGLPEYQVVANLPWSTLQAVAPLSS